MEPLPHAAALQAVRDRLPALAAVRAQRSRRQRGDAAGPVLPLPQWDGLGHARGARDHLGLRARGRAARRRERPRRAGFRGRPARLGRGCRHRAARGGGPARPRARADRPAGQAGGASPGVDAHDLASLAARPAARDAARPRRLRDADADPREAAGRAAARHR
eukprot:5340786-Prymnesium_polylepis.1